MTTFTIAVNINTIREEQEVLSPAMVYLCRLPSRNLPLGGRYNHFTMYDVRCDFFLLNVDFNPITVDCSYFRVSSSLSQHRNSQIIVSFTLTLRVRFYKDHLVPTC
jgi:hypothetical protein